MATTEVPDSVDAQLPTAQDLIWAVREADQQRITELYQQADVPALLVLLAAMCPDDMSPSDLLAWRANPAEYLRLRQAGVPAFAASNLAHRSAA